MFFIVLHRIISGELISNLNLFYKTFQIIRKKIRNRLAWRCVLVFKLWRYNTNDFSSCPREKILCLVVAVCDKGHRITRCLFSICLLRMSCGLRQFILKISLYFPKCLSNKWKLSVFFVRGITYYNIFKSL